MLISFNVSFNLFDIKFILCVCVCVSVLVAHLIYFMTQSTAIYIRFYIIILCSWWLKSDRFYSNLVKYEWIYF